MIILFFRSKNDQEAELRSSITMCSVRLSGCLGKRRKPRVDMLTFRYLLFTYLVSLLYCQILLRTICIFQCVKSKSVTNLAEATADPTLDQPIGGMMNPIEVHPLADAMGHVNLNVDPGRNNLGGGGGGGNGGMLELHAHPPNVNVHMNPPGSPQLRMNLHEPYPDPALPAEDVP